MVMYALMGLFLLWFPTFAAGAIAATFGTWGAGLVCGLASLGMMYLVSSWFAEGEK